MFNLDNYEPVEARIARFWADHAADGQVLTELVETVRDADGRPLQYVVKAAVHAGGILRATGFAEEIVGGSNVNRTSALENAETSAIGRALANYDYAKQGQRPSREEMSKVMHSEAKPSLGTNPPGAPRSGPAARNASSPASDKQIGMIRRLMRESGMSEYLLADFCSQDLGFTLPTEGLQALGKAQASAIIDAMVKVEKATTPVRSDGPMEHDPWADAPMIDPMTGETAQ